MIIPKKLTDMNDFPSALKKRLAKREIVCYNI